MLSTMQKRMLPVLLSILCLMAFIYPQSASAEFSDDNIQSKSAILIDAKTGSVLYQKNSTAQAFPASTTKILSSLVVLDEANLNDTVKVGREISRFSKNSSLMGLIENEELSVKELLYGLLLVSGNDAAATLAMHLGGSIEGFADKMNAKAAEIGMKDSHFVNPHGVHDENHYTTAADMAKLAMYAMKNYPEFTKIVSTVSYTTAATNKHKDPRELINSNKLIVKEPKEPKDAEFYYPYATGIKTGLTEKYAFGCLVASAKKGDVELIAVILGDATSKYNRRWVEAKELFEYGFANSVSVPLKDLVSDKNPIEPMQVALASKDDPEGGLLELIPNIEGLSVSCLREDVERIKADANLIKVVFTADKPLEAPIKQGDVVGTAAYRLGDETLCIVPVEAARDVLPLTVEDNSPQPTRNNLDIGNIVRSTDPGIATPLLIALIAVAVILAGLCIFRIIQIRQKRRSRSRIGRRRTQKFYTYRERR